MGELSCEKDHDGVEQCGSQRLQLSGREPEAGPVQRHDPDSRDGNHRAEGSISVRKPEGYQGGEQRNVDDGGVLQEGRGGGLRGLQGAELKGHDDEEHRAEDHAPKQGPRSGPDHAAEKEDAEEQESQQEAVRQNSEAVHGLEQSLGKQISGAAGDDPAAALKGLTFHSTAAIWLVLPCFLAMLLAAIQLRYGTITQALMRALLYVFVAVVCVVTLYPYYVMTVTAFRSNAETNDMYFLHIFPTKWIWSNLKDIVNKGVPKYLLNSGMIAGGATLIAMLCGIPAAYAMARMNFQGKKAFLGFVIMSQMFSPVVLLIGIAQLMSTLKLNDTILGLMLINAAFNQAFAIWLLRGTFVSISPEMEQAAKIDGCNTVQSLLRVLLPMAAPGIVTTLIFVFINAWNEYTISTVLISTASNRPSTVGITQFSSFNMIEWQYLFAASLLATIPVVILFMCIEKHLVSGLTSGGVKG